MTQQQKNEMQERARAYALCASLDSNEQGKINRAYIEGAKWAKERFKFVLRDGLHFDAIPRDIDNYPLEYRENAREYVLNTPHDYDSVEDTEDIAQLMECAYCQGMADRNNIGRWVSVNDELPEEGIYVATLDNGGRKDIRHFYRGKWYGRFGNEYRGITHWLPLPTPLGCSVFTNNYKSGFISRNLQTKCDILQPFEEGCEQGYEDAINDAGEWLKGNLHLAIDCDDEGRYHIDPNFVDYFKVRMGKGGEK